jgi:sodium/proline symporter
MTFLTFGAYMVLLLGIGMWGDRRFGGSYDGFTTADRSLGGWVTAISSAASSESAWVMLGLAGRGYSRGLAGYWASLGCTLGFVFAALLVVRQLRRSSANYQVITLGDYFEQRLDDRSKLLRAVSSLLIVFFMLVYVVAQFVGAGKQVAGQRLLGYRGGVVLGALVIGVYVLIGGYAAVCWTDLIQGLLLMSVLVIFPIYALARAGGLGRVIRVLRANRLTSIWSGGRGPTWEAAGYAVGGLGIGLGYPGMPHSIIRFVTVRDDRAARDAALITVGWGFLVLFGSVSLGIIGRVLMPGLKDPEHVLAAFTAQYFHPVVGGIILAAVSAAIMSTADSQLIMASTSAIHDLWYKLLRRTPPDSERGMVVQTRMVIGVLAAVAMGLALIEPQVIDTFVLFAWGALGASFTPVILLTLHWKRLTWQGALACFIVGPAVVVFWKLMPGWSEALYELIPGCIASTLAAVVVSLVTSRAPSIIEA